MSRISVRLSDYDYFEIEVERVNLAKVKVHFFDDDYGQAHDEILSNKDFSELILEGEY